MLSCISNWKISGLVSTINFCMTPYGLKSCMVPDGDESTFIPHMSSSFLCNIGIVHVPCIYITVDKSDTMEARHMWALDTLFIRFTYCIY